MRVLLFTLLLITPTFAGASFRPQRFIDEPTPAQIAACTEDAFRLCGELLPDHNAVKVCLIRKRYQLSAMCRESFR